MMKRTSKLLLGIITIAIVAASCAKLPKNLDDVTVKVNPSPLEVNGGKVDAEISATFPEKYVPKKGIVEITPVLKYAGKEKVGESFKVQGEKVEGNAKMISYVNGGGISTKVSFSFEEEMRVSELVLRGKVINGKKEVKLPDFKIADGVLATSTLVDKGAGVPAVASDMFQRIVKDSKEADIHFLVNQYAVRGTELKASDIEALKNYIKEAKGTENKEFVNAEVSAYASPEGALDLNTKLSNKREDVAVDYLKKELSKAKVDEAKQEGFLSALATPEDWEGFKTLLKASDIQDKDLILRVLEMHKDPDVREKEIRNLSAAFNEIAEKILPQLRRSKLTVNINIIGKSDDEIIGWAKHNPTMLSLEELLYATTLTNNDEEKLTILANAAAQNPSDWRAYNNMGAIYFKAGNLIQAKNALQKAVEIESAPEVNNNLGVIALSEGDIVKAEQYFGKAAGAGKPLDHNMGIISTIKGNYATAEKQFGECVKNNAAIAKILNKDYKGAIEALENNPKPNALTSYLKAVAGARTNNKNMVIEGIKSAVAIDNKMKYLAATDLEFAKYAEDSDFKEMIK